MIEILEKFKSRYLGLFITFLITFSFGIRLLINPVLPEVVIYIIGVGSVIKAVTIALQLILKYFPDEE